MRCQVISFHPWPFDGVATLQRRQINLGDSMWPLLTVFFCVLSAIVSVASAIKATHAARSAHRAWGSVHRRVSFVESELTSINTSVTKWQQLTEELSSSMKMSKIRRGMSLEDGKPRRGVDGEPDPAQDPEGWRTWMNSQLRANKFRG